MGLLKGAHVGQCTPHTSVAVHVHVGQYTPWLRYTFMAYAAPMAMLLNRQKPWEPSGSFSLVQVPSGPAWWPGGRTAQKTLRAYIRGEARLPGGGGGTAQKTLRAYSPGRCRGGIGEAGSEGRPRWGGREGLHSGASPQCTPHTCMKLRRNAGNPPSPPSPGPLPRTPRPLP